MVSSPFEKGIHPEGFILKESEKDLKKEAMKWHFH